MDKRDKKKLDTFHQRLQKLRQQLAGAKQQDDEPGEVKRLESEIANLESEARRIRDGQ